jgi:uncharacterized membrane protein YjgN (DUF898 family)
MSDVAVLPRPAAHEKALHQFEFHGSGGEFFRIWIVNIALSLITLGIYSAWAKVRTRRYFYGNTFVAGHSFDYHASPVRILIGRIIALVLFGGYQLGARISPYLALAMAALFVVAIPWLIVSSRRFNARNTSYRNVRFNFSGTYGGAFKAYILWLLAGVVTLGGLMPLAHRARDYYFINNHSFGGKRFATEFSGWSIYKIYLIALAILLLAILLAAAGSGAYNAFIAAQNGARPNRFIGITIAALTFGISWVAVLSYVRTRVLNLAVSHTMLDNRHALTLVLSARRMIWIGVSNFVLVLATIGLFYPWARVRVARYMADHMSLLAASDLDEFTSETFATQSAIGEEIAGFFDYDIGL